MELLQGARPTREEVERASTSLSVACEDLTFGEPVFPKAEVLKDNLAWLLEEAFGSTQKAAESLGTSRETVSRWRHGRHLPSPRRIRALANAAGLDDFIPLDEFPLCLMPEPLTDGMRRRWLVQQIGRLEASELRMLFPALRRLLAP